MLSLVPSAVAAQGNPVGPEFRVNTFTTGAQGWGWPGPSVAADASGNFVVVWTSDIPYWSIVGQRYAASGIPVGSEFRVNTYTTFLLSNPDVAADSSGNFVVTWGSYGQGGSGDDVFGQRFANSGAPLGPEFRINTYTTNGQGVSSVATDASGNFVVVWSGDGSPAGGLFGQRYANTGAPLGPEFRVNTYTSIGSFWPGVASDASGNFVVVWTIGNFAGPDSGVFGRRYASTGVPLGLEFRVDTYTSGMDGDASVAMDPAGNFVVVWQSYDSGSAWGVSGQRYASTGAPLGAEFRVNTYTTQNQPSTSVAFDAGGNFVVAWSSYGQDGSSDGVFGQRYASSGSPLGAEFRINTYTANRQARPDVTADAAGNFIVVWTSTGQDGWSDGVYGQRYSMIVPVELMHFRVE